MDKDKGRERVRDGRRGVLENYFFRFYALLATRFSLPIRRVRGREARCCAPKLGTVLTALAIHLFKPEKFSVAFCVVCFGARTSP